MLSTLDPKATIQPLYRDFLDELHKGNFSGEIHRDFARRLCVATDNSVYQLVPQAVIFPKTTADLQILGKLAVHPKFHAIQLCPRGGGTGTNGQSLNTGIIVDLSRHMNRILEVNEQEKWVRVQPGVVLDQLNEHLRSMGLFFAPSLSPSNRATLGGMINTDACGKGSRVYGKTSEHVLELHSVWMDGTAWHSHPLSQEKLDLVKQRSDRIGEVHRIVDDIAKNKQELIEKQFPKLQRFLSGYNLAHVYKNSGDRFNLNAILCGSEGTLAYITEAKLRLSPVPRHRRMVLFKYASFDHALRAATYLVRSNPSAIETIDSLILQLAKEDTIWPEVAHCFCDSPQPVLAVNLVEFEGNSETELDLKIRHLLAQDKEFPDQPKSAIGHYVCPSDEDIQALWKLRKRGVGLLGNVKGARRPVAFVEDTAVPPEHLADYIGEFRQVLDKAGLQYGMFGHVDVGCLHVRPALDLRDPQDEKKLRSITHEVLRLVKKYQGVLWSEHGKGFRSEFNPDFFGQELFGDLCRIKRSFDPYNQLNPGKLAAPSGKTSDLISIDSTTRGQYDRQIPESALRVFSNAVHCNGNGACFDYDGDSIMCPSSKVTRDRLHSPKGRATVLREWLRLLANTGASVDTRPLYERPLRGKANLLQRIFNTAWAKSGRPDFSREVYYAMDGCLACKACTTQCPIHVDIPSMRSEFLQIYHQRYLHPVRDFFVIQLERALPWMAQAPRLCNALQRFWPIRSFIRRFIGIVDLPRLSHPSLRSLLKKRQALPQASNNLLTRVQKASPNAIVLLQDAFTCFYDAPIFTAAYDLLTRMGYQVHVAPFRQSGKGHHIKGDLLGFRKIVQDNHAFLSKLAEYRIPIIAIDPAITLAYREEYPQFLRSRPEYRIDLFQEWLVHQLPEIRQRLNLAPSNTKQAPSRMQYHLFAHCGERNSVPQSASMWQQIFEAFGLELQTPKLGCCGMCGIFGHESHHQKESQGIYQLSWKLHLQRIAPETPALVTGYSCRSQINRFDQRLTQHPVQVLLEHLKHLSPLDACVQSENSADLPS